MRITDRTQREVHATERVRSAMQLHTNWTPIHTEAVPLWGARATDGTPLVLVADKE